jgi:nitroreductase
MTARSLIGPVWIPAASLGWMVDMEFQDVVRRRRMVRNFEERAIPRDVVERILENALHAPSAGFTQGWAFLVLDGRDETERFWSASFASSADRAGFRYQGLFNAPLLVVALSNEQAYLDRYAEPDKGWTDRDPERWPVPYWHVDTGFAALLMLLTVVDAGLGALLFGVFEPGRVRRAFDIPERYVPVAAIAIGYPAPDEVSPSLARGRRALEEVVHRGHWRQD